MKLSISKIKYLLLMLLLPLRILVAQEFRLEDSNFADVVNEVFGIIHDLVLPILSGLAFIVFFWGLSKFILNSNKPEEITNGRKYMIGGILALFVLLTISTIVGFISGDLGIDRGIDSGDPVFDDILLPE